VVARGIPGRELTLKETKHAKPGMLTNDYMSERQWKGGQRIAWNNGSKLTVYLKNSTDNYVGSNLPGLRQS
jgi:hypothetical protein